MDKESTTFDEILNEQIVPAIAADQEGLIFFVNKAFEEAYGWSEDDLKDDALTTIMPPHMRTAHSLGFSRFLSTQAHRILNKRISLPVYCKDESTCDAIHFITAKEVGGKWLFAALLEPKSG